MRRSLPLLACLIASAMPVSEAFARHDNNYKYWERNDSRYYRDRDRDWDRRDARYYRDNRYYYWRGSHYDYRPHTWRTVNVYTQPEYYQSNYSEIRCTDSYNPFGTLLGAGIGGLAGSTIGRGDGRLVATAGGAVLGALIGNNVTRQRCSTEVFRTAPLGRPVSWQAGPNEAYAVVPVREYRDEGRYCREYQSYATVGGRRSETYGTACMQPDGSWEIVDN